MVPGSHSIGDSIGGHRIGGSASRHPTDKQYRFTPCCDVFALCRHINRNGEIIPENIITKPPSAELRPDQKDSDSLPDYDILDEILYQYIEKRQGPKELIQQGFDEALVKRILGLVNRNEFKRYQTAPVLRVSSKAFGMGRRLPIVAKYLN